MASGVGHDIDQLNLLIEVTLDSAQFYLDAAGNAKEPQYSGLFRERGAQRQDIAQRLQARVKSLGGDAEQSGTAYGSAKRRFGNLRKGGDTSVISELEAGEDHVSKAYQQVVLDVELSDPVRAAVESEFALIQANHEETRAAGNRRNPS